VSSRGRPNPRHPGRSAFGRKSIVFDAFWPIFPTRIDEIPHFSIIFIQIRFVIHPEHVDQAGSPCPDGRRAIC
jgi:hypothetical protein